MALNSPGVEVKVIDESFYVPAEPGTRPLIVVTSKENKNNSSGTGIAVGTLKANAGKPYLLTSQRDLADIFGTPLFYTDSSQNPIHGGELNEYGLQTAYSYLGVSNSAYVVRSDLDLGQLVPTATAPSSTPADGTYWFDTRTTNFGIFEWNGAAPTASGGQKFTNKVPRVITDATQVDPVSGAPLGSVGKSGDYAVVSVTSLNKMYYKNNDSEWVMVGSDAWATSIPTIRGTKASPTGIVQNNSFFINTIEIVVGSTLTLAAIVARIHSGTNGASIVPGVSAAIVNNKLELYCDTTKDKITIAVGTTATDTTALVATSASASVLGIATGDYYRPSLSIQPHTSIPRYKVSDPNPRPTGSLWIKTTNVNLGAHWRVKVWQDSIKDWQIVEAPVYANNQSAIYGLDRTGGGANIARGSLYVQFNVNEVTKPLATFTLFRRELPDPTTLTSREITNTTFVANRIYGIKIAESKPGSASLGVATTITFTAHASTSDASDFAAAINASTVLENVIASVNSRNQVVIDHQKGGEIRLSGIPYGGGISGTAVDTTARNVLGVASKVKVDGIYVDSEAKFNIYKSSGSTAYSSCVAIINDPAYPADFDKEYKILGTVLGGGGATTANDLTFTTGDPTVQFDYRAYNVNTNTGTPNFYAAPEGEMTYDCVVSNWKQLKAISADNAPTQTPLDGKLWYTPVLDNVDIMIHNGNDWVGYLDATSPYYAASADFKTDPAGPLVTATKPITQSDGTQLRGGDLWLDSGDLENYPALYKWDGYNLKWIPIDNTDQTTEDGILFADARYNTSGANSDKPGAIVDLLTSNFVDFDTPDPDLYPRGMLLFNTRRSGNNVKKFVRNYINIYQDNIRENNSSQLDYYPHRWVNESGVAEDGHGLFGRFAQRKVVVKYLKALVDTNQLLRDSEIRTFNLIACPGYTELISNMVGLNIDRKQTAFVVGDTPFRLPSDATTINDWGKNARLAVDNGEKGLVTYDEYLGVYYPSGFTTDNNGNNIVVPASHMVLRAIALSDGVSYPWFAPAGTRRGKISNATSIGYVDAKTHEWQSIALNEGQRDTLYSVGINPITFLTGAGIVIYGQKTRAANASSLDRVNVARLVVYLRGQLTKLAKPYIFEPNDKVTRDELKSAAESIMLELVGQRGIYDYLVVCDDSNNTPSRIDRNELYLDIAIEPVKAVEFIYIPLRLKNTGEIAGLGK